MEFMYTGHVGRIHETEIPQLLLLARCLQINGILAALRVPVDCNPQVSPEKTIPTHPDPSSPPAVPPMDEDEEGEDDVCDEDEIDKAIEPKVDGPGILREEAHLEGCDDRCEEERLTPEHKSGSIRTGYIGDSDEPGDPAGSSDGGAPS